MWCVVYMTTSGSLGAVFGPYTSYDAASAVTRAGRNVTLEGALCVATVVEMEHGIAAIPPPSALAKPSECPRCARIEEFVRDEFALYTAEDVEQACDFSVEQVDRIIAAVDKQRGES